MIWIGSRAFFACEKKSAIIVAEKTSYFSATRATNGQISLQTAIVAEKMADFSASPARQGTRWCSGLLATIFLKHRSTRIHTDGASHFRSNSHGCYMKLCDSCSTRLIAGYTAPHLLPSAANPNPPALLHHFIPRHITSTRDLSGRFRVMTPNPPQKVLPMMPLQL